MNKIKKVIVSVFAVLLALILAFTVYKLIFSVIVPNKMPTVFGYSSSLVVSGSMEPTYSTGDMVVCKAQNDYEINDVIIYYDESDGIFVLHRIISESADGFITKGDFNPSQDPAPVKLENVQGKVVLDIPNMKTYRDMLLGATIALLIEFIISQITRYYRVKSKKRGEKADEKE